MVFMAITVTIRVILRVKTTHVTCKAEHVLNVRMGYLATTVTVCVLTTVKTTRATYLTDLALVVHLDGLELFVMIVRSVFIYLPRYKLNYLCVVCKLMDYI